MAQDTVKVDPPSSDPTPPLAAPKVSSEEAHTVSRYTLLSVSSALVSASNTVKTADATSDEWTDDLWNVSGYDKQAVTNALNRIVVAYDAFMTECNDDLAILANQAGA